MYVNTGVKVKFFPAFSLSACIKNMCMYISAHTHTNTHKHTDTQIDCCTANSMGDFIDDSLKSSLKQNKLFTSQLESNRVRTVVSPFSDDK